MKISYFYLATLSFFLGIFTATFYPFSLASITWLLLISLAVVLIQQKTRPASLFIKSEAGLVNFMSLSLMITAFAVGALRLDLANVTFGQSELRASVGETVTLVGQVVSPPEYRENTIMLEVEVDSDKILASVDRYERVNYGDIVELIGRLDIPESFTTDLGRTFNYPGYLKAKGIEYRLSFAEITVLESGQGNWFLTKLYNFKEAFISNVGQYISDPAAALGGGLLLGIKESLGDELENAFRRTGIIHIVVLSGYNIMLVVIFVTFVLGYFFKNSLRVLFGVLAIVIFALLVGLSATVVRASIMASLLLLIQATGRAYYALRGLMVAGVVMIMLNPYLLVYDVGFQLSFLATAGLILLSPYIEKLFKKITDWFSVRTFIVATVATQIAVLPLLLYQIGEFSVVAVLVNVLVLPMVPVAMLLTFLTSMTAFFSNTLASLLAVPTLFSLQYINELALWFSSLPYAAFIVPTFPFYLVVVSYLGLALLIWRFHDPTLASGMGDLGEKWLAKNTEQTLDGWKIVEETDVLAEIKTDNNKTRHREAASKLEDKEVPVFFR